jgi:hypothetical protein
VADAPRLFKLGTELHAGRTNDCKPRLIVLEIEIHAAGGSRAFN